MDIFKDFIIPIVAALLGGAFTLFGVIFTIKYERSIQERNERLRVRPFVIIGCEPKDEIVKIQLQLHEIDVKDSDNIYHKSELEKLKFSKKYEMIWSYHPIIIHVADSAEGILESIIYDNTRYYLNVHILLRKNTTYALDIGDYIWTKKKEEGRKELIFCIHDLQDNDYYYSCSNDWKSEKQLLEYTLNRIEEDTKTYYNIFTIESLDLYSYNFREKMHKMDYDNDWNDTWMRPESWGRNTFRSRITRKIEWIRIKKYDKRNRS